MCNGYKQKAFEIFYWLDVVLIELQVQTYTNMEQLDRLR